MDYLLALPDEICADLGRKARARRLMLNLSVQELAGRVGVSDKTLSSFERTGRCTLGTFVRILEALNALPELAPLLVTQPRTIDEMRQKSASATRQRAYRRTRAGLRSPAP